MTVGLTKKQRADLRERVDAVLANATTGLNLYSIHRHAFQIVRRGVRKREIEAYLEELCDAGRANLTPDGTYLLVKQEGRAAA